MSEGTHNHSCGLRALSAASPVIPKLAHAPHAPCEAQTPAAFLSATLRAVPVLPMCCCGADGHSCGLQALAPCSSGCCVHLVGQEDQALDGLPQQGVLALIRLQLLPEEGSQLARGGALSLEQGGACTGRWGRGCQALGESEM